MLDATQSGCINHPSTEAVNRCKQCMKPTCRKCTVVGPTGKFCSEECKSVHEAFIQRAQTMDTASRSAFFIKIRRFLSSLVVLAVILAAVGILASLIYIPVLTEVTFYVRSIIGI